MIAEFDATCEVKVNGGISPITAAVVVSAGTEMLATGSAVFHKAAAAENLAALRRGVPS